MNKNVDPNELKIWRQKLYPKPIDICNQVHQLNKTLTNKLNEHQFYYTVKEKVVEVVFNQLKYLEKEGEQKGSKGKKKNGD